MRLITAVYAKVGIFVSRNMQLCSINQTTGVFKTILIRKD